MYMYLLNHEWHGLSISSVTALANVLADLHVHVVRVYVCICMDYINFSRQHQVALFMYIYRLLH